MNRVRFDDRRDGQRHAWELSDVVRTLTAEDMGAVVDVLAAAEQAALDGFWVAGFVSYDAAPAFVPEAPVPAAPAGSSGAVPLAWFGVFTDRHEVEPLRWDPMVNVPDPAVCRIDERDHATAVDGIRAAIERGDVYQVNLTARLDQCVADDAAQVYARLVEVSGAAHCAQIELDGADILSVSPELFFEIDGHTIRTRPMKGTARRGRWSEEDVTLAKELRESEKDRAENVMIVDLLRNDLGRIAVVGTVRVEELLSIEAYPTVWQLTSTIAAMLPDPWSLVEVFRAMFPCGSVTGAPKIAAMRAIAALETSARGAYCGTIGWIAPGRARASFNVAIRTAVVDGSGRLTYGSGGGITWDSSADAEWDELQAKAAVLTSVPIAPVGLIETMRWAPANDIELLPLHLARLQASGERLGLAIDPTTVRAAIDDAVLGLTTAAQTTGAQVRLVVAPDGTPTVTVAELPVSTGHPVRLALDGEPIDPAELHWYHKTTDRERYDRRRRAAPDADDVVMVNLRGEVTETTIASIAVRVAGRWCTPPIRSGCLPGVFRRHLIERGAIVEQTITVDDLRAAEELAVFNALRGWQPAEMT